MRLSRLDSGRIPARKPDLEYGVHHSGRVFITLVVEFGSERRAEGLGAKISLFMLRNSASGPEIGLPGRISGGCCRENLKIVPPAFGQPEGRF